MPGACHPTDLAFGLRSVGFNIALKYLLFRSCLLFAVIFLFVPGLYGVLFEFFVVIFTICVFSVSMRESEDELANCEEKIASIDNIHTKKL